MIVDCRYNTQTVLQNEEEAKTSSEQHNDMRKYETR